jgi:hypothetical protein
MTRGLTFLGLGAGLMYFFDPDRGRRRRALFRDQWIHGMHEMREAVEVLSRDLGNRATGLASEARSLFAEDHAPDAKIEARVRAALGRVVSHPRAIRVETRNGCVTVSGPILASEVEHLLSTARCVRGVCRVENRLEVHRRPGDHPALQGGTPRPGVRPELLQERWSPTAKLLVGVAGGLVALRVLKHPVLAVAALGGLGLTLTASGLNATGGRVGYESYRNEPESAFSPAPEGSWASP